MDSEGEGTREDTGDKARMTQPPHRPDKGKQTDLNMMELDIISLEEVSMHEGLTIYENMWEASALDHPIDTSQEFRVRLFLNDISRRQEKTVKLLETLCRYVLAHQALVNEIIISTKLWLADIEKKGMSHFTESKEHVQAAVRQIKAEEISVKFPTRINRINQLFYQT